VLQTSVYREEGGASVTFLCQIFGYDPKKLQHMTEVRQKVMLNLLEQPLSLTNIANNVEDHERSTIYKSKKQLLEQGLVRKDENKVYHLTDEGRAIALLLAVSTNREINGLDMKIRDHLAERVQENSDRDIFEAETLANQVITTSREVLI
jgi:predicted transcriptional regulator